MRVRRAEVLGSRGSVEGPRSASRTWELRAGVVLCVEDSEGHLGMGEASPLPGYSPDTLSEAREELEAIEWARVPDPEAGEDAVDWLGRIRITTALTSPSARFALETALLDLLGHRCGEPMWRLLHPTDAEPVPLGFLIGGADDASILEAARRAADRDAHTVKVKIGGPSLATQLPLLGQLREILLERAFRLDANQTLSAVTLADDLTTLAAFSPELVEEPVPTSVLATLPSSPVPLGLDESLQDEHTWDALSPRIAPLRLSAVVLKPTTLGGFGACLDWARRTHAQGLDVTISHAFEGPVALTACAHLALAVASRTRASGLALHGGLAAWPRLAVPAVDTTTVVATSEAGLGIDPQWLGRLQ